MTVLRALRSSCAPAGLVAVGLGAMLGCGSAPPPDDARDHVLSSPPVVEPPPPVEPPPAASSPETPASPPAASTERDTAAVPPVAALAEARVRALLDVWVAVQNERRFADYERLYAQRFVGVRRSGPRTRTHDRAGWLDERRRMFRLRPRVEVRDVSIETSSRSAVVRFTQVFSAGPRYRDVGPKQLVVVLEGTELFIAREEMLESRLAGAATAQGAPAPTEIALVVGMASDGAPLSDPHPAGTRLLLALHDRPEEAWFAGAPRLLSRDDVAVRRRVAASGLPTELTAWRGQEVVLFDADGEACRGRVAELSGLHRVVPHFGTVAEWNGDDVDADPATHERRWTDAEVAASVWTVEEGTWVVGEVVPSSGDCANAVWARAAAAAGQVVVPSAAPADLAAQALAAFRRLPAWAQIQTDYRASVEGATGRWDEAQTWSRREVRVWQSPSARGERWVSVYTRYEDERWTCDGFGAGFWALFALEGEATLRLLSSGTDAGSFYPEAAMMTPGAAPTFFGTEPFRERVVRARDATGYPITRELVVPFHDCPC